MIEAYEIGIKLALQDGVSDGIAAIRRDLGSLDQAIARTTLRLGELQRIGVQALAASQGQPERAAFVPARRPAAAVMPPLPEPDSVAPAAEKHAVMPAQVSPARPRPAAPAVVVATLASAGEPAPVSPVIVARQGVAAPVVATRPAVVVEDAVRASVGPRPQERSAAPPSLGVLPAVPARVPAAATVVRPAAPRLRTMEPLPQKDERAWKVTLPRPAGRVSPASGDVTVAPHQAPVEPALRGRTRQAGSRHEEAREAHARHSVAASGPPAARMVPAPAGPAAIGSSTLSAAPPDAPSYAPPAASPRGGEASMRGDVFLDGMRVGRWMSEQMARDAGRPSTGPTGFDPRRSPVWPGAAVTW